MDIAIHFNKINIDDSWFIFKVVDVVRGNYDSETNTFETEFGTVYDSIYGEEISYDDYFGFPTTMKELKEKNSKGIPEDLLLSTYLYAYSNNFYLGYYDEEEFRIKNIAITLDSIFEVMKNEEIIQEDDLEFSIDSKVLSDIKDSKSIAEVRSKINQLMEKVKEYKEGIEDNESDNYSDEIIDKAEPIKYNLKDLQDKVLSNIIAQDEAVKTVTTTLFVNSTSLNPKHRSHILIAGPSGTGKTEMVNIVAKELGIPCFKADATAYTRTGYVGKEVYSMLTGLINAADGDITKAQNGILVIDEIDKKNDNDIGGTDVLYSLLKIMDRDIIEVDTGLFSSVKFDTSNLTIIFMGAFTEIYERINKENSIGFKSGNIKTVKRVEITEDDFIKYGMPSEFMGRIGTIAYTNEFTSKDLIKILCDSNISPIKQEKEYFENLGINVEFTFPYINEIANKSAKSKIGARNLKKLVKDSLKYAYEDVLIRDKVKVLKLIKDTVNDNKKYYIE